MLTLLLALPPALLQDHPLNMEEGAHEFEVTLEHPVETLESLFLDQPGVELQAGQTWPLSIQNQGLILAGTGSVFGLPAPVQTATVLKIPFRVPRSGRWSLRLEAWTFDAALAVREPDGNYLGIDDDNWFALNPLLPELKLRKGIDYELLLLAVHKGMGKAVLHAQRKPFRWKEQAEALIAKDYPHIRLVEDGKKEWGVVLENETKLSAQDWARGVLEEKSAPLRILALEKLSFFDHPDTWEACMAYGHMLGSRTWAQKTEYFGRKPTWEGYWDEVRVAFHSSLPSALENWSVEIDNAKIMTLRLPEFTFRKLGDNYGAAKYNLALVRGIRERSIEDHSFFSVLLLNAGGMLHWSGLPLEGLRELRRSLALGETLGGEKGDIHGIIRIFTYFHIANALQDLGDEAGALEAYQKTHESFLPYLLAITKKEKTPLATWFRMNNAITVVAPRFATDETGVVGLNQWWQEYYESRKNHPKERVLPREDEIDPLGNVQQMLTYFAATEAHLASLLVKRGDLLAARKHLMEALAGDWMVSTRGGTLFDMFAQDPNNRLLSSPSQTILDGIEVARGFEDVPMEICLALRAYLLDQEMAGFPNTAGWLPVHELCLRLIEVLMREDLTTQDFLAATQQYRWTKPGAWKTITRQQRWESTLEFSQNLVSDLNVRLRKRLLAFNHPKVQKVHYWVKAACEQLGVPYPEELEIRDPDRKQEPPILTLWSPKTGTLPTGTRTFTVQGWLDDLGGLPDLRWRLDGGPWASLARLENGGQAELRISEEENRWRFQFPLTLPQARGKTTLEIQPVSTSGLEGENHVIQLEYQAGSRNLYVLAFGVADYESDALDLQWPVKDAEDVAAALSGQSDLFDEVKVEVLRNTEVTSAELQRRLKSTLRQAGPDDTIVVFGAGHGIRDEDGEYWFLTADATPEDPYSGVSRHVLERLVTWSQLKANRRILLLDTCQSGRGAADEASRGASGLFSSQDMDAALAGTGGGVYILAGSTETGSALEAGGNGLFTAGVLAALRGEGDTNGNGQVTVEELRGFVVAFVEAKTDGRQRPTFPLIEGGEDFPLTTFGQ